MRLNAEISEVAAAGLGRQARGDLGLHQEHGAQPVRSGCEHRFEDRRSDVVGQIPGDHGRTPGAHAGLQHIRFEHFQAPRLNGVAKLPVQIVNQVGIDLDRDHLPGPLEERLCKRAFARTDFDDEIAGAGAARRRGDAVEDGLAGEKVLPETAAQRRSALHSDSLILPAIGWPNEVAGVNSVNSSAASSLRRVLTLVSALAPLKTV